MIEKQIMLIFDIDELKAIQEEVRGLDNSLDTRISAWINGERQQALEVPKMADQEPEPCSICDEVMDELAQIPACEHYFCNSCIEDNNSQSSYNKAGIEVCSSSKDILCIN